MAPAMPDWADIAVFPATGDPWDTLALQECQAFPGLPQVLGSAPSDNQAWHDRRCRCEVNPDFPTAEWQHIAHYTNPDSLIGHDHIAVGSAGTATGIRAGRHMGIRIHT